MEVKTDFLAEEWLETLEKEIKPVFPGVEFSTWSPTCTVPGQKRGEKITITFSERAEFIYSLKGASMSDRAVISSLKRYVFITTKKYMKEK